MKPETDANPNPSSASESAVVSHQEPTTPFTLRAILLAVILGGLGIAWAIQSGLVRQSVYVGGSVPAIPAVAVLLLLAAVNPLLRRWGLTRGEVLLIYIFVGVAVAVADPNALLVYFFAFIVVARYAPSAENQFGGLTKSLPDSFSPRDMDALRGFVEGHAPIPWGVWLPSLLGWGTFFFAMWVTTFAILRLFRDRWIEQERLRFPIVDLAMNLAPSRGETPPMLRDPLMWLGLGLAAIFNLLNIANAFLPGIPAPGRFVDIGPMFPQPPLSAFGPAWISLRPEIFGLGYLMSTEVLFTAWFSYFLLRVSNVVGTAMGFDVISGYYDYQEIATGAYLGILFALVWMGRGSLANVLRQARAALTSRPPGDPQAALIRRNQVCTAVAILGFAYQVVWTMRLGMSWWIALLYIGLLIAFAIVYARVRAETGAPIWFLFPFWQQQKLLLNVFGTSALGGVDGGISLAALAGMGFLARGTYPQLSALQIEAMEIGNRARIQPKHLAACILTALPFGLIVGTILFLASSYHEGFYSLDGGMGEGGFRVTMATQQYRELTQWRNSPQPPNLALLLHTLIGFGLALVMSGLRSGVMGWPLHPLGFAMATSYGFHLWAPFLAVWLCKLFILKAGGAKLYRRFIPFFLGLVVGHYLVLGIVWGGLALFIPELTRKFVVHFA